MRVQNIKQRLGDLRKVVVDPQVNPRRQQRKRLQHPFRMRIFAAIRLQHQARCNLRILVRELRSNLAQECELALVIISQLIAQDRLP